MRQAQIKSGWGSPFVYCIYCVIIIFLLLLMIVTELS